ncbi:hypothetical protein HN371_29365 [Candidatus Poribacteria bacterium]|jgi:hypothetical protein|nr:hypothetical protein [Candidatus Poribacteria bacterium]MBT7096144.1 hypothetical protein [Candidatus Poribacteria bacterium]
MYVRAIVSQVSGGGWGDPIRVAVPSTRRGTIEGFGVKASTSAQSQVTFQLGYATFGASAASAAMVWPFNGITEVPPAANDWNVSGLAGGSAATFQHVETWTDDPMRYDYSISAAAPFIYSGAALMSGASAAGLGVAVIGNVAGNAVDLTFYFDIGPN